MGLLDEAIREHLDLKRRRGADPAEIERAEREALGPVRRQPQPEETEQPDARELSDHAAPAEAPASVDEAEPAHDFAPEPEFAADAVELEPPEPPAESPAPVAGVQQEPPRETSGPATVEYDVEQDQAEGVETDAAEDVLEETPDFLQDTPDHDRLWFEQRPPRDFDFEG